MGGTTGSEKTSVALKIKVKLGGMCHLAIDDRPSWAVTTLITIAFRLGKNLKRRRDLANSAKRYKIQVDEPDMVPLPNDNDGDLRINSYITTSLCKEHSS